MKLEVKADRHDLKNLKEFLESQDSVDEVNLQGEASEDDVDLVEIRVKAHPKGVTVGELADEAGLPRRVCQDALVVLKSQGKVVYSGESGLWRPVID